LDKDGSLVRCGERQGLEQLLMDLMARSPHGKWPGSAHFGLRDFLEDARTEPASLLKAVPQLNLALEELGAAVRAQSITFTPGAAPGTGTVEFTLTGPDGQGGPLQMKVEA
jgi:hypothetical protein